jgi:hypothetical protein
MAELITSTLEIRRRLLRRGYRARYEALFALQPGNLSRLADVLLAQLLSPQYLASPQLTNVKGRDARQIEHPAFFSRPPESDEMLYLAGTYPDVSGHLQHFASSVVTNFLDFPTNADIRYQVLTIPDPKLPPWLTNADIPFAIPLELKELRIGLQFFKPRIVCSLFGLTPVVDETLLIEANQEMAWVLLEGENLKLPSALPLEWNQTTKQLSTVLQQVAPNFNLEADYLSKVKK